MSDHTIKEIEELEELEAAHTLAQIAKELLEENEELYRELSTHESIAEEAIGTLIKVQEAHLDCIEDVPPELIDTVNTVVRNLTVGRDNGLFSD